MNKHINDIARLADRPYTLADLPAAGSENAPLVSFDGAPVFAYIGGRGRLCLETILIVPGENGTTTYERRVVAHLSGDTAAFESLREAINGLSRLEAQAATAKTRSA